MLLSAVSVLVVAQSSSEIPEGLMNNPVHYRTNWTTFFCIGETWSLLIREEHRLRIFDNRVLRNTSERQSNRRPEKTAY